MWILGFATNAEPSNSILPQVPGMSASDRGIFLRPTMPTWSSGCLIHVKPYELTRCPFWNSCHWVAQIAKLIYFQMLRACEKFGSSFTNTTRTSGIPANIWMYWVRTQPNEKGAVPRGQISRALARQVLMSSVTVGWYDVGELPTPLFCCGSWQFGQHFVWHIWLVVWRPGVLLIVGQIFRMSW